MMRLVLLSVLCSANGNMLDLVDPGKIPPALCKNGCAQWSALNQTGIWAGGVAPTNAKNNCAQPGLAVNSHPIGAWCTCAAGGPAPAPPGPPNDPDHPLAGKILTMLSDFPGYNTYVSFAYTDAPPGEPATEAWMRLGYSESDAMPLRFDPVAGKKDVYNLMNMWPQYERYVKISDTEHWLHSFADPGEGPAPIKFVATGKPDEYTMVDATDGAGRLVSFCTGACDGGQWLRADYTAASDAMPVKLGPVGANGGGWGYCTSPQNIPEQINVQIGASPDTVVLSFVTFEAAEPGKPPVAMVAKGSTLGTAPEAVQGVTHYHETAAGDKRYYMHFIRLSGLAVRTRYSYKVRSGGSDAEWSDAFSFRSGYADGVTAVNIYGDMGVYSWNNMGNNLKDCAVGDAADLIIHLGDHAYNEGESDEARADGYMQAWQPVLANCPWAPVVGNHEYYDGAELYRYLNQTWEGWGPVPGADIPPTGRSTATSALGALLSRSIHHAVASQGSVPSHTSRFFSFDFGLIHFVNLDLNMYYGDDPCGDVCRLAQLDWLKKDLAAANANREAVPWVVAGSHFPFYCTGCDGKSATEPVSARWYNSMGAEYFGNNNRTAEKLAMQATMIESPDAAGSWQKTVGASSDASIKDLIPLLQQGGVDMYVSGHWHYYESLYPATLGQTGIGGVPTQKDFVDPNVTVHVTTGNGGPPSADSFSEDCPGTDCGKLRSTRFQSTAFGYGRLTAYNTSHLKYTQIANKDGSVVDEFMVVQHKHGPFGAA